MALAVQDQQMKVWCDSEVVAAKAATAGTFEQVGSDFEIKTGAQALIGLIMLAAPVLPTSGENGVLLTKITSKDLGISEQVFITGPAITDGIATNDKEAPFYASFLPISLPEPKPLDGAKVKAFITSNVAVTGGWDAVAGLIYANQLPDANFRMELLALQHSSLIGGDDAKIAAGISAAAETAFTETIDVDSTASVLKALMGFVNPNAPTAQKNCVGYTSYVAPAINDFQPQKWPFCIGYSASLGTPVGTQILKKPFYWPTRFTLPRKNFSISVAQKLAASLTNAGDGLAAAGWA